MKSLNKSWLNTEDVSLDLSFDLSLHLLSTEVCGLPSFLPTLFLHVFLRRLVRCVFLITCTAQSCLKYKVNCLITSGDQITIKINIKIPLRLENVSQIYL